MTRQVWLLGGLAAVFCLNSFAQSIPDAGRLEERKPPPPPTPTAPAIAAPAAQKSPAALTEGKLLVNSFHFTGDTGGIDPAVLLGLVKGEGGRVVALADLHMVADQVERHLQSVLGLLVAKAWVPLQDVKNGEVEIRVLQGTLDGIQFAPKHTLGQAADRALAVALPLLPAGSALRRGSLEEAAFRMSDYLAMPVRAVLTPAPALGHYLIQFEVDPTERISGAISVDNTGNRYTSQWHDALTLKVANLSGHADQLTVNSQLATPRQRSLRLHYQLPLDANYRFGATLQGSRYELGGAFSALAAHGHTQAGALDLQRTFQRSRNFNLYGSAELLHRKLVNYQLGALTSEHAISEVNLGLRADWTSGEDFNYAWVTVTAGNVKLAAAAQDALSDHSGPELRGGFGKAVAGYTYSHPLSPQSSVVLNLGAQLASKNLDSSETFLLGGMGAVRAYPIGETAGDQSLTAQLEYHRALAPGWRGSAFYDLGWITQRKRPWPGYRAENVFMLKGAGLTAVWTPQPAWDLTLTATRKLGRNPVADPRTGNDSDGRDGRYRVWCFISYRF